MTAVTQVAQDKIFQWLSDVTTIEKLILLKLTKRQQTTKKRRKLQAKETFSIHKIMVLHTKKLLHIGTY